MATLSYAWQAPAAGAPDSYNLYEGPSAGAETLLAGVPGTSTAFPRAGAAPGVYFAFLRAVWAGAEGPVSNEVSVTILPNAPTLTATPAQPGGVPSIILQGF